MTCRHAFHKDCVDKWLETGKNNCPACRSRVCRYSPAYYPILIFRCRAYLRKVAVLLSHDFFSNGHCLVNHAFVLESGPSFLHVPFPLGRVTLSSLICFYWLTHFLASSRSLVMKRYFTYSLLSHAVLS